MLYCRHQSKSPVKNKQDTDCLSVNVGGGVMIKPAAISSARRGFLQAGVTVWELPSPSPSSNSKAAPSFIKPRASAKPVFWEAWRMLPSQCLQSMQKKTSNNLCILIRSFFQTLGKERFCELICSLTRPCLGRSLAWNFIPRHVLEWAIERLAMGWKLQRASYSYWTIKAEELYLRKIRTNSQFFLVLSFFSAEPITEVLLATQSLQNIGTMRCKSIMAMVHVVVEAWMP